MDALLAGTVLVHAGVAALWLGSMAYSLFVVQPKLTRMFDDPERVEDGQRCWRTATGGRWCA
ncbi:hypothetical protein [Plantactinospora veratri]